MKKRFLSLFTALTFSLTLLSVPAIAVEPEDTGLCPHHPAHTAECGYLAPPTEGASCQHEHGPDCYTQETICLHIHDANCYSDGLLPVEGEDKAADTCIHVCSEESGCITATLNCLHVHDESCGYPIPTEGAPCQHEHGPDCYTQKTVCVHVHDESCYSDDVLPAEGEEAADTCIHVCGEESGCIITARNCLHVHNESCYSDGLLPAEGEDKEADTCIHVCGEESGCITATLKCLHVHDESCYSNGLLPAEVKNKEADTCAHVCGEESGCITTALNCQHIHNEICGYVGADPGHPCEYVCTVCPVQAMIDVLPDADSITVENRTEVEAQLGAIDVAKYNLTDEQQDTLDFTRYQAVVSALLALEGQVGADKPELLTADWTGSGTESDPYQISTIEDLQKLATNVNAGKNYMDEYFVLTTDIKLNDNVLKADGTLCDNSSSLKTWTPIGKTVKDDSGTYRAHSFWGIFDGCNHTISGLYVNDASMDQVGVFGYLQGTIKNVRVVDSYFNGAGNVGSICGECWYGGIIENCYNSCPVSGSDSVGGICGNGSDAIRNCTNTGNILGISSVGGICGSGSDIIANCNNSGTITGVNGDYGMQAENIGGICGYNGGEIDHILHHSARSFFGCGNSYCHRHCDL